MKVSVVIPVYNAVAYVEQAVDSALMQPEVEEVFLVEDGSGDDSLSVCERLVGSDRRVCLLRHPDGRNRGAGESRNLGVRESNCEFVAFLDADDYYLPERFGPAREVVIQSPYADGVYDAVGTDFETEAMREWWASYGRGELTTLTQRVSAEDLFDTLTAGNCGWFHTNGIVVRRKLFERTGLFDLGLRMAQDSAMWLKMSAVGNLLPGSLDRPVAMRRLHGENRIVKHSTTHKRYIYFMLKSLIDWADEEGLPTGQRHQLLEALARSWFNLDRDARREVSGTAFPPRFLLALASRNPGLFARRKVWRLAGRALGASRLKQVLRGDLSS